MKPTLGAKREFFQLNSEALSPSANLGRSAGNSRAELAAICTSANAFCGSQPLQQSIAPSDWEAPGLSQWVAGSIARRRIGLRYIEAQLSVILSEAMELGRLLA